MSTSKIAAELIDAFVPTAQQKLDALNELFEVLFIEGPNPPVMEAIFRTSADLKSLAAAFEQRSMVDSVVERLDEPLNLIRLTGLPPVERTRNELREALVHLRLFAKELKQTKPMTEGREPAKGIRPVDSQRHHDVSATLMAVGQISIWSFHDMINMLSKVQGYTEMLEELHQTFLSENKQENLRDKVDELGSLRQKLAENNGAIQRSISRIRVARGKIPAKPEPIPLRETIETMIRSTRFSKFNISWSNATLPNVLIEQDLAIFECVWINLWHLLADWLAPETGLRAHCTSRVRLGKQESGSKVFCDELTLFIWMESRSQSGGDPIELDKIEFSERTPKHDLGQVFATLAQITKQHGLTLETGVTTGGLPLFSLSLRCRSEMSEETPKAPEQSKPSPAPQKPKTSATAAASREYVLVVDDEKDLRALLELKITRLGYPVITAENLTEARNILRTTPVRMVLADLFLSQESGLELLHEVKRGHPNLPFVFLTGANEDDLSPAIHTVLTKYANEFLRKPLSSQQLKETLTKYCGG